MPFDHYNIEPLRPTALESRECLPLPPTDFSFYPAVNSYTLPAPLDSVRLRASLAQTLQLYPSYAGTVAKNPSSGRWQIQLLNRAVRLSIGTTTHGGPFAAGWKGERHPDYYEELVRANVSNSANTPLFQAKVTTWEATDQTAIMISQSYVLGDAFTITSFTHCWSSLYQGKEPPLKPTFEKYFLPEIQVPPRAAHTDLPLISWMAADFDEDYHAARIEKMDNETERLDLTFRIGRSDAFAGYLISTLQGCLDEPVQHAHQLVTVRDREMEISGERICLPRSTTGNAYMIWGFPLQPVKHALPSSIATTMYQYRQAVTDPARLGHIYTLYNSFYEKPMSRDRCFVDAGYADGIAMNWLVNSGLNDANFGFDHGVGHIEWEALENFFQVWRANPIRQEDGAWWQDSNGLQVLVRIRKPYHKKFLEKVGADQKAGGLRTNHPRRTADSCKL